MKKTLKLVFHESNLTKRKDEQKETLTFKGFWDNESTNPPVIFKVTGCEDGKAAEILEELNILVQGEFLYLDQGENPQKRLDYWLSNAMRRKDPKVADFEAEIKDFDEDMLLERTNDLYDMLKVLVEEDKTETKKFDFLLECLNAVRIKVSSLEDPIEKQELIDNIKGTPTTDVDDTDDDWEPESDEEE